MSVHPSGDAAAEKVERGPRHSFRKSSSYFDDMEVDQLAAALEDHQMEEKGFYAQVSEMFSAWHIVVALAAAFAVQFINAIACLGLGMWGNGFLNAIGVASCPPRVPPLLLTSIAPAVAKGICASEKANNPNSTAPQASADARSKREELGLPASVRRSSDMHGASGCSRVRSDAPARPISNTASRTQVRDSGRTECRIPA